MKAIFTFFAARRQMREYRRSQGTPWMTPGRHYTRDGELVIVGMKSDGRFPIPASHRGPFSVDEWGRVFMDREDDMDIINPALRHRERAVIGSDEPAGLVGAEVDLTVNVL